MLAFSNFGHPLSERTQRVQEAVRILDSRRVDSGKFCVKKSVASKPPKPRPQILDI
jgi:hypothetical protein